MAAKAKTTKKPAAPRKPANSKKSNKPKTRAPKAPSSRDKAAFYFVLSGVEPRILNAKPPLAGPPAPFKSFEEVKDHAVDQLIELIDNCERRLYQIKRAESFDHYHRLTHD